MPEMHLRQPGFAYNACGLFTKKVNKEYKSLNRGFTIYLSIGTKLRLFSTCHGLWRF